jgi:membrane protein
MATDGSPRALGALLKQTVTDFIDDECPRMAAALSYYTVFSLPPLLILILLIVGMVFSPGDVQGALEGQMQGLMGPAGGEQVRSIIEQSEQPGAGRPLAAILGIGALVFGATGVFIELQNALNRAWQVKPDPEKGGIVTMLSKRLLSFGMVLVIAFLLLVSLVLSAVLAAFGDTLAGFAPGALSGWCCRWWTSSSRWRYSRCSSPRSSRCCPTRRSPGRTSCWAPASRRCSS